MKHDWDDKLQSVLFYNSWTWADKNTLILSFRAARSYFKKFLIGNQIHKRKLMQSVIKKETNKNKLKVKKEKQIKLWLGSGSMLRWKWFFVVFFLILTRLMSEINRASANSTTTRQPITKILTVTTQHSEWRNKQRKRNSILGGRKQSKEGERIISFPLVCCFGLPNSFFQEGNQIRNHSVVQ